jgi:hypothetical protein
LSDLVAIAAESGYHAVDDRVWALIADTPSKKIDAVLTDAGLGRLELPVFLVFGADLSLSDPSPLRACAPKDGKIACTFDAKGVGKPGDYVPVCKGQLGGTVPLATEPATVADGRLGWRVLDVSNCWKLDAVAVKLMPKPMEGLDGIGTGDDFIPPELSQLTQAEVFAEIKAHDADFGWCARKYPARGTMIIKFHVADDGSVGSAEPVSTTFAEVDAAECVLQRFRRLRFTPPMGGYQDGEYPISLL